MNPEDPIAQAIDADFTEGVSNPSRADAILRMLPRLLGSQPEVQTTSGLPQTGQEVFADVGALAGQAPSGIGNDVRMGTNLGDVYARRAALRQRGDIAEQELIGRRADRTLSLIDMLSKSGPQAKNPFGAVDPSKFTPESLAAFQQTGDYSKLVLKETSQEGAMQPLPGVPGVFFRKGVTGQPEMVNAAGQPLTTEQVQAMEIAARKAGAASVSVGYGAPVAVDTAQGPRLVLPPNRPGGKAEIIEVPGAGPISPASKMAEPSDAAKKAAGYADRMIGAESIIERIGPAGYPTETTQVAGRIPMAGRYAQTRAMTPNQQMVRQAQEDWVRSKLRHESGAVIAAQEVADEISTYFPQPGDGPDVIKQKAAARQIATRAMMMAGGRQMGRPRPDVPGGMPDQQPAATSDMDVIDFNSLKK